MLKDLINVAETLESLVEDKNTGIYLSGMHALDESLIFGTKDAYLYFATELLKFVIAAEQKETETIEIENIQIQRSNSISTAVDLCSEIYFNDSHLVETEDESRKLYEYWWSSLKPVKTKIHMASYESLEFEDCDYSNVKLTKCNITGMEIDGVLIEELLARYKEEIT